MDPGPSGAVMATPSATSNLSDPNYPFAPSPDVLRTYEKDGFVVSKLTNDASELLRTLLGARFAHKYSTATSHLTELLYLSLTTLIGNRTLGEEYCDVVQVEDDTLRLAEFSRRIGYIASVVFAPWTLGKVLPALRRRIKAKIERNLAKAKQRGLEPQSRALRIQEYVLGHIDSITSLSPIYAINLAMFYFTGSYYHISKRLFGLRYIFTKEIKPNEQREGYEVLGVLLVLQMAVQSILHIRSTYTNAMASIAAEEATAVRGTTALLSNGMEVMVGGLDGTKQELTLGQSIASPAQAKGMSQTIHTEILDHPRYDMEDGRLMAWIPAGQQRKCTLCLEPFKDPSATTCGHVFCWTCIQDWVKEKAECPLCRQSVLPQKILPLRG